MTKVNYKCSSCKKNFKIEYTGWKPSTICIYCGGKAWYPDMETDTSSVNVKKYRDIQALVIDKKTGQPLWIDTKGRRLSYDSSDVRYDLRNDPHGWKATGHKVRQTDKYGRAL
jgi:DNA-directed RNA polymerase subunit RPC12/RpoP